MESDWRYNNIKHMREAVFRFAEYKAPSDDWDHDHCNGCWAKFAEFDAPDVLHSGYVAAIPHKDTSEPDLIKEWKKEGMRCIRQPAVDGYTLQWVCEPCFRDFRDLLGFKLMESYGRAHPVIKAI